MDGVRQYILTVLSAAIIASLVVRFAGKQQAVSGMIKLIAAVFVSLSVISPIVKIRIHDVSDYLGSLELDADDIISEAKSQAANETALLISDKSEAYIKDKAASYGAEITASIGITEPDSLTPDTITIEGEVSPYLKEILQGVIADDLGIQKEKQIWK